MRDDSCVGRGLPGPTRIEVRARRLGTRGTSVGSCRSRCCRTRFRRARIAARRPTVRGRCRVGRWPRPLSAGCGSHTRSAQWRRGGRGTVTTMTAVSPAGLRPRLFVRHVVQTWSHRPFASVLSSKGARQMAASGSRECTTPWVRGRGTSEVPLASADATRCSLALGSSPDEYCRRRSTRRSRTTLQPRRRRRPSASRDLLRSGGHRPARCRPRRRQSPLPRPRSSDPSLQIWLPPGGTMEPKRRPSRPSGTLQRLVRRTDRSPTRRIGRSERPWLPHGDSRHTPWRGVGRRVHPKTQACTLSGTVRG
jgi:hypothetical protein